MNTKSEFLRTWQVFLTRSFLFFVLNTDSYTACSCAFRCENKALAHPCMDKSKYTKRNNNKKNLVKLIYFLSLHDSGYHTHRHTNPVMAGCLD